MASLTHLKFRKMTLADLALVNQLENAAHYHPWSKKLLADAINSYACWILLEHQQIVGYAILKIVLDEAELLNIVIAPAQQGRGLGKVLLTKIIQEAQQLGAKDCFLEVRESNSQAYQLYERFGFNEIARRANYYPTPQGFEDALIMVYSVL